MKHLGSKDLYFVLGGMVILIYLMFCGVGVKFNSFTSSASAEDSSGLKTINIGYPSSGKNWGGGVLGVADEYGYLNEYLKPLGYKAKLSGFVGAAPAIHEALTSKDLDYVAYAGFAGILGKSNQVDTKLLAVTEFTSTWRLIVSTQSGINSIEDLKGKKIAYTRGASPQMYLIKVLEEGHLNFNDIEPVNMSLPDGLSAIASGGVDAAVVTAGQEDSLVKSGKVKVIHSGFSADPQTYYEPMVLIGRTDEVENDRAVAVAIIKALLKAKDKINEDKEGFYKLSAERSGNPLEVIMATAQPDLDIAYPLNLDKKYLTSLHNIQDFLHKNNLIKRDIDIDSWADASIVNQAIEEYNNEK